MDVGDKFEMLTTDFSQYRLAPTYRNTHQELRYFKLVVRKRSTLTKSILDNIFKNAFGQLVSSKICSLTRILFHRIWMMETIISRHVFKLIRPKGGALIGQSIRLPKLSYPRQQFENPHKFFDDYTLWFHSNQLERVEK